MSTNTTAAVNGSRVPERAVTHFMAPSQSLGALDADAVAALVAAAGDIALVVDRHGIVEDIAYGNDELAREWGSQWVGRLWVDTVATDSRPKVEAMLTAAGDTPPRWRHVNHPVLGGPDIPIQYIALKVRADGQVVAIGRDLRALSTLQQRLVTAQQALERDYGRLRQMEMRYRLLFQATPDAILIVEASTLKVSEANPAAADLLADSLSRVQGRNLLEAFDETGAAAVQTLFAGVRATGRSDEAVARAPGGGPEVRVSATLFRHDGSSFFLVRLTPAQSGAATAAGPMSALAPTVEHLPDGIVLAEVDGRVVEANPAFLDQIQLATREQARGQSLERWLGRPGVDLPVLLSNLRQHGTVRLYATHLRGEFGERVEVELSAVTLPASTPPRIVFTLRNTGLRLNRPSPGTGLELPRSMDQLKELVGRVPLKELVRETTDVVEQMCIEAALELTNDNRASAAEILGLSRQSLYVKLRRYGLAEGAADGDATEG